ncbi:MAG: thiamine pyrophosphate-binding protein [Desulfobacterales bacterium]|mgnify:CR=1 FL=1|jgi:acetolactate synthase I/II/III large subunit|nr:thiamine pyrophosphate-binding protein [Desulfobacteraceae bacterium]MBT7086578.1 thiamine pyrophosphate-binding protein [Desulfobacterales bacterium]
MAEIYGGHLVAKYLKEFEGIETVFSLSGGHIDRIYDGFLEYGIRLIDVRHEQAAAMMAHSYSIYSDRPGVCLVTAGPGFTNAITGIANAHLENSPLVVICGSSPVRDSKKGALQDMPQKELISPIVKWSKTCHDINRIPEYISSAFRHAVSDRPGPVFLEIPPDVLGIKTNEEGIVFPEPGGNAYRSQSDPDQIKAAADLINAAKRPMLLGGSAVRWSPCDDSLKEFIKTTGIPFSLINNGRGALPENDPLALWDCGMLGMLTAMSQADLIIALGVRFNWVLMFGQGFPQAKMVRVDIDASEINRNRQSDVGLVGDLDLVLKQLNKQINKKDHSGWINGLKESILPMIQDELKQRETVSDPIHPVRLVEQVRNAVGEDAIYLIDGGDTSYFGTVGVPAMEKSSVIASAGGLFGCLGTGIPFGIAAKAAKPEKTVVVINGDGSFGLNAMEFETAVRHNLPIVCVICNDQAWGMIKHGQEITYGPDRVIGSNLGVIHYEKIVEAVGGYGELVEKDEDIIPAIKRAIASGKPSCINVITDPTVASPATYMFAEGLKME